MRDTLSRSLPRLLFAGRAPSTGPGRIEPFLSHSELKGMFETIGARYDLQNHLLSLGYDRRWRRRLVDAARPANESLILDMAVGTGDIAIPLALRYPTIRVVGIDYSPRMLRAARRKIAAAGLAARITLRISDIRHTPLDSKTADLVTSAFTLRNLPDRKAALAEFHRLLRPGGRLLVLELAIPQRGAARLVYRPYFDHLMPLFGNLLSRTDYAYSYLRESVHAFPQPSAFCEEMRACGFDRTKALPLGYGTAVLYVGHRGGASLR